MRSPLFLSRLFLCLCLGRLYLVLKLVNCQYLCLYVFPLVFILLWLFSTVQLCLVPHLPLETVCAPTYEGILFSPFLVLELDPPHSYSVTVCQGQTVTTVLYLSAHGNFCTIWFSFILFLSFFATYRAYFAHLSVFCCVETLTFLPSEA